MSMVVQNKEHASRWCSQLAFLAPLLRKLPARSHLRALMHCIGIILSTCCCASYLQSELLHCIAMVLSTCCCARYLQIYLMRALRVLLHGFEHHCLAGFQNSNNNIFALRWYGSDQLMSTIAYFAGFLEFSWTTKSNAALYSY